MNVRLIDELTMDPATDAAIRAGMCACFPQDIATFSRTRAWHGSGPAFSVILEEAGKVIAHAGVVGRTIRVGDERVRVGGVQNVFVLPERRGQGLSGAVLGPAMEEARRRRMEVGLLFCIPGLGPLYARLGWRMIPAAAIHATDATGERHLLDAKNIAMFYPLARTAFPSGEIDLLGNDW